MMVLLVFLSFAFSMDIHSSIHRPQLANSYFKKLRVRAKSGPTIATPIIKINAMTRNEDNKGSKIKEK